MKVLSSERWPGPSKIILGVDVGTTFSAVSFAYLFQGGPQIVQRVGRWPGQGSHRGDSKIPTLVYYDQDSKPRYFGAETLKPENREIAEDEGWTLAEHFKLHLHPRPTRKQDRLILDPLPFGVSLATIYTDFLGYLLQHTQAYFENHVIEGSKAWRACSSSMLIVLTHPNGWSIREQSFLTKALRNVGPEYQSCEIKFVTESEASVHFCMFHGDMDAAIESGTDLVVCDAGGSTVDTTVYHVEQTLPFLKLKERNVSACIQAGGLYVDFACENHLANVLAKTDLNEDDVKEYTSAGVKDFESNAKRDFSNPEPSHYIDFRNNAIRHADLGIRRGRMSLAGSIIASFFEQVIPSIIQNIRQQVLGLNPKYLLLVGGFGESLYLRRRLSGEFSDGHCQLTVVEDSTSKAAADGAVIWAIKSAVIGRITRVAYGTVIRIRYDPKDPSHQDRPVTRKPEGDIVGGCWSEIVEKGVLMGAHEYARCEYLLTFKPGHFPHDDLTDYTDHIWIFQGDYEENPGWVRDTDGDINPGFERLCTVSADLSGMEHALKRVHGPNGPYDELRFNIAIQLGGIELNARIEWVENDTERFGPVSILAAPLNHFVR